MGEHKHGAHLPLQNYKRTKIIATVGPATHSYEAVKELIDSGANGLLLNFSHGTNPQRDEQIKWIRKAGKALGKPVAIIQDLQGPKIRLGDFEDIINVQKGETLRFGFGADWENSGIIPTQFDLAKKIKRGERLYLYDGKVRTKVTSIKVGIVYAEAENNGILLKRKA
jgi:pyruvate kinase